MSANSIDPGVGKLISKLPDGIREALKLSLGVKGATARAAFLEKGGANSPQALIKDMGQHKLPHLQIFLSLAGLKIPATEAQRNEKKLEYAAVFVGAKYYVPFTAIPRDSSKAALQQGQSSDSEAEEEKEKAVEEEEDPNAEPNHWADIASSLESKAVPKQEFQAKQEQGKGTITLTQEQFQQLLGKRSAAPDSAEVSDQPTLKKSKVDTGIPPLFCSPFPLFAGLGSSSTVAPVRQSASVSSVRVVSLQDAAATFGTEMASSFLSAFRLGSAPEDSLPFDDDKLIKALKLRRALPLVKFLPLSCSSPVTEATGFLLALARFSTLWARAFPTESFSISDYTAGISDRMEKHDVGYATQVDIGLRTQYERSQSAPLRINGDFDGMASSAFIMRKIERSTSSAPVQRSFAPPTTQMYLPPPIYAPAPPYAPAPTYTQPAYAPAFAALPAAHGYASQSQAQSQSYSQPQQHSASHAAPHQAGGPFASQKAEDMEKRRVSRNALRLKFAQFVCWNWNWNLTCKCLTERPLPHACGLCMQPGATVGHAECSQAEVFGKHVSLYGPVCKGTSVFSASVRTLAAASALSGSAVLTAALPSTDATGWMGGEQKHTQGHCQVIPSKGKSQARSQSAQVKFSPPLSTAPFSPLFSLGSVTHSFPSVTPSVPVSSASSTAPQSLLLARLSVLSARLAALSARRTASVASVAPQSLLSASSPELSALSARSASLSPAAAQ